jgi:hypothetical protein
VALVWTVGAGYLGVVALLTWQALRAQSITAPDADTLRALAILISAVVLGIAVIVGHARTRPEAVEMRDEIV